MAKISGGEKLERALRDLAAKVANPATLRAGFLENATYSSGESVAMIASLNEYGVPSRGQPPRPFFRQAIAKHKGEWPAAIAGLLKANNMDAVKTLNLTGEAIVGQIKQSIIDLVDPPLAPSTVQRKGFDKPLIERGIMLNAVSHEVVTS